MTLRTWFEESKFAPLLIQFRETSFLPKGQWDFIPLGKVLAFSDPIVQRALDVEFYDGYGGQEVPDFFAWSTESVMCVHEYDGSTSPRIVPRFPPVNVANAT